MREASATEARQTNRLEVLIELASESGLDVSAFIERMNDGSTKAAFDEDLQTTAKFGAQGFPTFLVKYGEKGLMLRGYQSFATFQSIIKTLAGDAVIEQSPEKRQSSVLAFVKKHSRVAPIEIQTAFDLSEAELRLMVDSLLSKRLVRLIPAGNGSFIESVGNPMICDPETGLCAV